MNSFTSDGEAEENLDVGREKEGWQSGEPPRMQELWPTFSG